jgi:hypothetical protein
MLVPWKGTVTGADYNIHEDERPAVIDENEEPPPPVSVMRILKKNMPEWPHLLIGSLASMVVSSATPIFVVFFGEILRVRN